MSNMKRCPTCNRTFTDPNLSFCIDDGTPLVIEGTPGPDPEATVVSPSVEQKQTASASDWQGPAYQPPPQFPPPPPAAPRKKLWPWVVGFLALLILVLVGLGIAAAIVIPSMMKAAQERKQDRTSYPTRTAPVTNDSYNTNTDSNNANGNADSNSNANSNAANENENANENTAAEPPTDQEAVLNKLKNIEDEWTVANLNADKKKLATILADDYVGTQADGTMQGKADYLRDIKPDPSVAHWQFENLKLSLNGSRATLTGLVSLEITGRDEALVLRFTDKFVWRDGRWQAVSSEVSPVKETQN